MGKDNIFKLGAFIHIDSPDQIGTAVQWALNPTKIMKQAADEYLQYFFHKLDGKASGRFKQVVEDLVWFMN